MSTLSGTISGVSVSILNGSISISNPLENRTILKLTVIDSAGTATYTRGMPVVLTDSVQGVLYTGYIQSSSPLKDGLSGATLEHAITCMDTQYLLDKRTNSNNYNNWYAGNIVTDFIDGTLAAEGVTAPYGTHRDSTIADFNRGVISGEMGASDLSDGDLELLAAGSTVTIAETTTANFATGTLTNVTATANTLTPTTVNALKLQASLTTVYSNNSIDVKFWGGSMTVASNDTFYYDVFVSTSSPQSSIAVNITFSDGSSFSTISTIVDQNNLAASPTTDLSSYASGQWYSRVITLTAQNGKIINSVSISSAGGSAGVYTGYIKNCYLGSQSGSPFFGLTTTTTNINPPLVISFNGYSSALTSATVAAVWLPQSSYRISSGYSIDVVKLLKSSIVTWTGSPLVALYASYDGGNTYAACVNNSALPALPAGSNVASLTLTLKEQFGTLANATLTDPTVLPILTSVNITLTSAPNPTTAKSDIVTAYAGSTAWNAGTYVNLGLASDTVGIVPVSPTTRNWNDNLITNQTFFPFVSSCTESASSGAYVMSLSNGAGSSSSLSRLDFIDSASNFTLDIDLKMNAILSNNQLGITYRQTYWSTASQTFAYFLALNSADLVLLTGGNGPTPSFTQIGIQSGVNPSANTTYHVKIVVTGNLHQVYWNGAGSPGISVTDTTYPNAGFFGFYCFNPSSTARTYTWDNLSVNVPPSSGSWTSPSVSLASLGTCGNSAIAWTENNTVASGVKGSSTATIQTSVDGGSTYQACTNGGAIPNLPSGTNVSGKSILTKVLFSSFVNGALPEVSRLVWRVLGAYPGSSGTRSTIPLGNDTMVRANQSGTGTSFDGQAYTKTGTGTVAIASNELTITNTTGDVHELLGSRTSTDEDGTVRFQLSASTINAGIELRYIDTNNFYRLQANTTTVSIIKKVAGASTTLATLSMALSTGTPYYFRFRVVGSGPISLRGNVWAAGSLEPTINATNYLWNDNNWSIVASD